MKVFYISHEIQLHMNAITFVQFPIDFAHRKLLTASVYFTTTLSPADSTAPSYHFPLCALIFDTWWFYAKPGLSLVLSLSSGLSHKKRGTHSFRRDI